MATKDSLLRKLGNFLHGLCCESFVIIFTIIDIMAITTELLIRMEIIQVPPSLEDGQDSTETGILTTTQTINSTSNAFDPGGKTDDCVGSFAGPKALVNATSIVHYISLVIAGLFLFEILLKIVSRRSKFFKDISQWLDALIVATTLALEITFTVKWQEILCYHVAVEAATYIVIFRLCRIPRMCNIKKEQYARKLEQEMYYLRETKKKAEMNRDVLHASLQKQQRELGILKKQVSVCHEMHQVLSNPDNIDTTPITNGYIPGKGVNTFAETTSLAILDSAKKELAHHSHTNQEKQMNGSIQNPSDIVVQIDENKIKENSSLSKTKVKNAHPTGQFVSKVTFAADEIDSNLNREESLSPIINTDKKMLISVKGNENYSEQSQSRSKPGREESLRSATSETMDEGASLLKKKSNEKKDPSAFINESFEVEIDEETGSRPSVHDESTTYKDGVPVTDL